MQVAAAHQEGTFQSDVPANTTAQLHDSSFTGPTTLSAKASLTSTRVGVVFPIHMKRDILAGEASVGGTMVDTHVRASNGTLADTLHKRHYAPGGGFALMLKTPDQRFGLRVAADYTLTCFICGLGEYELLATYAPMPNIELLLGYREMRYTSYTSYSSKQSDIDVRLAGPAAGFHFRF